MKDRPNILIVHSDQIDDDAMGCAGNPIIRIPRIPRSMSREDTPRR